MINNLDKWSVRLKQRLHVFQDYKISKIVETTLGPKQKIHLPSLLLYQQNQ